jgi:hypothetical protein
MPRPFLTNSITLPAADSGGALHPIFIRQWSLPEWKKDITFEQTPEGVLFATHVDVTADPFADTTRDAMYRLACYYLISRLPDRFLYAACEALYDVYSWEARETTTPPALPERRLVAQSPEIRHVPAQPFIFEED